jgi:hypothetical protein
MACTTTGRIMCTPAADARLFGDIVLQAWVGGTRRDLRVAGEEVVDVSRRQSHSSRQAFRYG